MHPTSSWLRQFRALRPSCAIALWACLPFVLLLTACDRGDVESNKPEPIPSTPGRIESTALTRDTSPPTGTLFERLSADHTGITHQVTWDKPAKYDRVFYSQNTGGGAAAGDYDGDGLPDVYLTSPSGGSRLYRNLGGFKFEDVSKSAGVYDPGFWGTGASWVDIDNDGDLDLYACGYEANNRLYINQGDGTFKEQAKVFGLDFWGASIMVAFADYDNDGDLDAYLLTSGLQPGPDQKFRVRFEDDKPIVIDELREYWQLLYLPGDRAKQVEAGQFDHLYRNDGPNEDGQIRFTEVTEQAGINGADIGQAATWWDYNNDGWADLYVANDFWGGDHLYRNNGDGTFTNVSRTALPHTPWSSMGADYADINNDGLLDFMGTDMSSTSHYRQKVGMGDMSKSAWFLEYAEPRQYPRNAVYLNTGHDRFMEVAYLTGLADSDWTWTTRFEDFDEDGHADVIITNGMTRDLMNTDLNRKAVAYAKEGTPEFFAFWMKQDLFRNRNLAFRNAGDLRFEDVSKAWGFDRLGVSFGAATADFDRDGDLDLVVNNMDAPAAVYRNRSAGRHRIVVKLVGRQSNRMGVGTKVVVDTMFGKQARYHTLSRGWASSSEPIVHFGLGDADKVKSLTVHWPSGHVQRFNDLPADHVHTVTEPTGPVERPVPARPEPMFAPSSALADLKHVEDKPRTGDFERQPLLPYRLSRLGPGMAVGDVDGDGDDDLYLGGAADHVGQLWVNNDGQFKASVQPAFERHRASEDMGALFFDADGDNDLDLYVVSGGVEDAYGLKAFRDRLYHNDGKGRFTSADEEALPEIEDSGSVVAAADYDRDGDLDLFVGGRVVPGRYPVTPSSRLLMNLPSRFKDVTDRDSPGLREIGLVTDAAWSDVDGDGWVDLLIATEWGPIHLWRNDKGRLRNDTVAAGLADRRGWFNGIVGRDLDGDGDIDFVVTNVGLNTKYHATYNRPALIYYGRFGNDPRRRLVECEFENGVLYPGRGKSCSTAAMPFLGQKFTTFDAFAKATLNDVYGSAKLSAALRLTADTLESGVLLNDGKGRFTFKPLPRLAQAAPCFGAVLTDVDYDGHTDLVLAQNFYSPQPETGHMDGGVGLLLHGRGDGTFDPVWPNASGVVVSGDATALISIDLDADGRDDLVFARNNDTVVPMTRTSQLQRGRPLSVRLAGRAGNPTAIGAVVTAELDNGTAQTAQVSSNGGYLSQSSARLTFGIPNGLSAKRVIVRWPNGEMSAHDAGSQPRLVIQQPQTTSP